MTSSYYANLMSQYQGQMDEYTDKINKLINFQSKIASCNAVLDDLSSKITNIKNISTDKIRISMTESFGQEYTNAMIGKTNNIKEILNSCNIHIDKKKNEYEEEVDILTGKYNAAKYNYNLALEKEQVSG